MVVSKEIHVVLKFFETEESAWAETIDIPILFVNPLKSSTILFTH